MQRECKINGNVIGAVSEWWELKIMQQEYGNHLNSTGMKPFV